jgi:addiction module HigA family antidote
MTFSKYRMNLKIKDKPMKSLRNPNRKPTHPGAVLREDVLPELCWTESELANRLMVSRQTVCDLLREEICVNAEMANRLARTVGGSPESWLRMQEALDLLAAEMKFKNNPGLAPKTLAA